MYDSCSSIVQTCFMNSLYNSKSVLGLKIAYFRFKYRINFTTSTRSRFRSSIRVTYLQKIITLVLTKCFPSGLQDPTSRL